MTKTETKMIRNIISDSCKTDDEKVELISSFVEEYTLSVVDKIRQFVEDEGYDLLAEEIQLML